MSKAILIEDRSERKNKMISQSNIDLSSYDSVLDLCKNESFKELKRSISKKNLSMLVNYDVIISHRSAWSSKELDLIKSFCTQKDISLVLFSGGISSSFYSDTPCSLLTLDVSDLYSENLMVFLANFRKTGNAELQRLQYGDKWRLNILLEARNSLAVFLEKNENISRVSNHIIQDPDDGIGLPESLKHIQKSYGYDVKWYEENIAENAFAKLTEVKNQINKSNEKELHLL